MGNFVRSQSFKCITTEVFKSQLLLYLYEKLALDTEIPIHKEQRSEFMIAINKLFTPSFCNNSDFE